MTEFYDLQELLRNAQYILNDLKKVDQRLEEQIDEFEEKEPTIQDMRQMLVKKQLIVAQRTRRFKEALINKLNLLKKRNR